LIPLNKWCYITTSFFRAKLKINTRHFERKIWNRELWNRKQAESKTLIIALLVSATLVAAPSLLCASGNRWKYEYTEKRGAYSEYGG
jgi:hypothetical protein